MKNSSKDPKKGASGKPTTRNSSTNKEPGEEVISPIKHKPPPKRKDAPNQVYRPVVKTLLLTDGEPSTANGGDTVGTDGETSASNEVEGDDFVRDPNKKKPTPENSAETAPRSCPT